MGKKNTIVPDKKLVEEMVSEYNELKIREKQIKDRKAVLADAIKSYSLANGTKDDNGSFYSDCDGFTYGAQCKKSVKFDDDKAVMFFQSKGYEDCVKLVPQVVESAVEKRFYDSLTIVITWHKLSPHFLFRHGFFFAAIEVCCTSVMTSSFAFTVTA